MTHWLETIYSWFYSEIFTRIGFLLALILMAGLLRQRRSPSSTIAWLLAILLLPNVGVPLYIIFGGRKVRRLARRKERIYQTSAAPPGSDADGAADRLLASYGVPPPSSGNCFELVPSGVDGLRARGRAHRERALEHPHHDLHPGQRPGEPGPGRMPDAQGGRRHRRSRAHRQLSARGGSGAGFSLRWSPPAERLLHSCRYSTSFAAEPI